MLIELLTKKYPGMRQWLTQRLTAVVMAAYIVSLILLLALKWPANYESWMIFVSPWWWRLATLLFFVSLCMHAWLGVRDVLKDYVSNLNLRAFMQTLVDILLIAYAIWMSIILLEI